MNTITNTTTITEALAEVKLINNKIAKQREWVQGNLLRQKHMPDPMAAKGGTKTVILQELQSIEDLEKRLAHIRIAIMQANLSNRAEVMGVTKSIYEWLVWKKEVAPLKKIFLNNIYTSTKVELERFNRNPQYYRNVDADKNILVELETNVDYMEYASKGATVGEILDKLDGVLSLKNSTITITV